MSERLNEYLARDAGDYLDQIAELLRDPGTPDLEQLLRLARGARGSAQRAGAGTVAGLAERLEDVGRSVVSGTVIWSDEVRELVLGTVEELKVLLRALNRWGPAEEARLRSALDRWESRESDVVPIEALFFDDDGPHLVAGGVDSPGPRSEDPSSADRHPEPEPDVVPIETLLLQGDGAYRAALDLRSRLEALTGDRPGASDLLDELFDLVRLVGTEDRRAG